MRHMNIGKSCFLFTSLGLSATYASETTIAHSTSVNELPTGPAIEQSFNTQSAVTSRHEVCWSESSNSLKRPGDVTPVILNGVRYEALHWGKQRNLGQNGGFIAAYDITSGAELWVKRIYLITYGDKSPQKYDIFIHSIAATDNGSTLTITDENCRVFQLRLADQSVVLVSKQAGSQSKPHPNKPSRP